MYNDATVRWATKRPRFLMCFYRRETEIACPSTTTFLRGFMDPLTRLQVFFRNLFKIDSLDAPAKQLMVAEEEA